MVNFPSVLTAVQQMCPMKKDTDVVFLVDALSFFDFHGGYEKHQL